MFRKPDIKARRQQTLELQSLKALMPPITVSRPLPQLGPLDHGLIFASPHSGRIYPADFQKRSPLPISVLRRNEDAFMDKLIAPVAKHNIPILVANFPRCFVDVNRAPDEILSEWQALADKKETTQRAMAGLGVVPTIISDRIQIYKTLPSADIVQGRLDALYHPYHRTLQSLIAQAKEAAGEAVLIDCHSMPSASLSGKERSDIILGDRFGASARPDLVDIVEQHFSAAGYRVTRNYPYAGGYVTSHYGQPDQGCNVIQIEVNRGLYVNTSSFRLKKGFAPLKDCFEQLAVKLKLQRRQAAIRAAE